MRIFRINLAELIAGGAVIILGGLGLWEATGYSIGTARVMGPGYFPLLLGGLLIVCGLGIILVEGTDPGAPPAHRPAIRGLLAVLAAICVFAFTIDRFGLVPATALTIIVSSVADPDTRLRETLILAAAVSLAATAVFVWGLGLPLETVTW